MYSKLAIFAAQNLLNDISEEGRKNLLDNLRNHREMCVGIFDLNLTPIMMIYVKKTNKEVVVHDADQFGEEVVSYLCNEIFKKELKTVPVAQHK